MITEKELDKMIENLDKWMLGEQNLGEIDTQIIGFINSNNRIPLEKNIRALLMRIKTGKDKVVKESGDE